jgi:predicted nucleotidyltransferase
MDKWKKFLITEKKKKSKTPSRKSGAGIERSLKWFLDTGPQKKGGYPKKRRPNFRKKKFNDISAPPGAPGGLEEDIDPETFEKKPELNPKIFRNHSMKPKVRKRLLKISEDFLEKLELLGDLEPMDIRLTGSLANYNWSKYSDVDLHIIFDFSQVDKDPALLKAYLDAVRVNWNDTHDIRICGFEVEIYVEDANEEHIASGLYSVLENKWIKEPDPTQVDIDHVTARKKSDDLLTQINLIEKFALEKPRAAMKSIERVRHKIRRMRAVGLTSDQAEFSPENIAFKILRREEALDRLGDLRHTVYDKVMSMSEKDEV